MQIAPHRRAAASRIQDLAGQTVLDSLFDGVYLVDSERKILSWNRGAERLTGYTAQEVVGRPCFESLLRHVDARGQDLCFGGCPLSLAMERGVEITEETYLHHKSGHRIPVSIRVVPLRDKSGAVVGAAEIFRDNAQGEKMRGRVEDLERIAMLDPLTELPNRRYLEIQLDRRLSEHERYGWPFGLLFIDIDHFKRINDSYGHDFGDLVLRMVARTMSSSARIFDTVGRWGGEEFLALVANVRLSGLLEIGTRLRTLVAASRLNEPYPIGVTISLGAVQPSRGETAEELVRRADRMMYRAKASGRNQICWEDVN